ncbi:MAG: hypothetical protein LBH93_08450 [Chitinispirillales bacterium]|jgi:shikimate kinase|nr:hypothetical protein [Chitinispirillales bacterium]
MSKNIILIGFASSGKSTTAAALRERTDLRHVDLDRVVEERYERRHGMRLAVRHVFLEVGADGFEALESDALRSLSNMRSSVLSTGGRTPMSEECRTLLKQLGSIVYLRCGADAAVSRMTRKGAPVSMGSTPEEIAAEWSRRDPVYSALADIIVNNESLTPDEAAKTILKELHQNF